MFNDNVFANTLKDNLFENAQRNMLLTDKYFQMVIDHALIGIKFHFS